MQISQTQQEGLTFVTFVSNISVLESEMLALLTGRQLRSSAMLRFLLLFHGLVFVLSRSTRVTFGP